MVKGTVDRRLEFGRRQAKVLEHFFSKKLYEILVLRRPNFIACIMQASPFWNTQISSVHKELRPFVTTYSSLPCARLVFFFFFEGNCARLVVNSLYRLSIHVSSSRPPTCTRGKREVESQANQGLVYFTLKTKKFSRFSVTLNLVAHA